MTRYIAGFFLVVLMVLVGATITLSIRPIPLGFPAEFLIRQLVDFDPDTQFSVDGAQLAWSPSREVPYISADTISYVSATGDLLRAQDVKLYPSSEALWIDGTLALSNMSIERLELQAGARHVQTSTLTDLFAAISRLSVNDAQFTRYIEVVSVRDVLIRDTDGQPSPEGSKFLLTRSDGGLSSVLQLAYFRGDQLTRISGRGYTQPGKRGRIDIELDHMNPADLAGFSSLFSPLSALSLPVDAKLGFDLAANGQPERGEVSIRLRDGKVALSDRAFEVNRFDLEIESDLVTRAIKLKKGRIKIDGVDVVLTGEAEYDLTPAGEIGVISANLDSRDINVALPGILQTPIKDARARFDLRYLGDTNRLEIDGGRVAFQDEEVDLSGNIDFSTGAPVFGLTAKFATLTRSTALNLWPQEVTKYTRNWVTKNMTGGRIENAYVKLDVSLAELLSRKKREPLREDAVEMGMQLSDISIRPVKHLPPITGARATLIMRGKSFRAELFEGEVMFPELPDVETSRLMRVTNGVLEIPNYFIKGAPSKISLDTTGDIGMILYNLNRPPWKLLQGVNLDLTRLAGEMRLTTKLEMPLWDAKQNDIVFSATGTGRDVGIEGKLGAYEFDNINGFLEMDASGFNISGRGLVNQVPFNFNWDQGFANLQSTPPRTTRLALTETISSDDLTALGFGWAGARIDGRVPINIKIDDAMTAPRAYHFNADLTPAKVSFSPLGHEKDIGQWAQLAGRVDFSDDRAARDLTFSYEEQGATPIVGSATVVGKELTSLSMPRFSLGTTQNVEFDLTDVSGYQQMTLRATALELGDPMSLLLGLSRARSGKSGKARRERDQGLSAVLGDNLTIEAQIDTLRGSYDEQLDGFQLVVNTSGGLFERMRVQGTFGDGTELVGDLARTNPKLRSYTLQSENGSNLLRFLGVLRDLEGGALLLQGEVHDDGMSAQGSPQDMAGRFEMQAFRAREVPVLARLLSLGSFTGIADTLSGDGIAFDIAQFKFIVTDGKLQVKSGRFNGPALGLTTQGAIDTTTQEVDFGGTVVPAYGINSLISRVPLVGRVLTGRKGEGIFGFSYRVGGPSDDLSVLVNPLSILTPGIFRRIFEIGIGELPDVEVTTDDLDEGVGDD
ncbi:MAG TPA: hypothetical protein DIT66_05105 [Rhodobiaceae bacterium]|nr:hypothetical protein [Rhodobiaceae bacterium]